MYVVVVGLGEVGRHVLAQLEREGHDVVAVDIDPRNLAEIEEAYREVLARRTDGGASS